MKKENIKHTQGPWIMKEQGDANHFCILKENNLHWIFAIQMNGEIWTEEQKANMKLIVTSPELLQQLIYILDILKIVGCSDEDEAVITTKFLIEKATK